MPHLKPWERQGNFDQVEKGLSRCAGRRRKPARCLECDARNFEVVVNTENCKECGYCAEVCGMETFGPAAGFNAEGLPAHGVQILRLVRGLLQVLLRLPRLRHRCQE